MGTKREQAPGNTKVYGFEWGPWLGNAAIVTSEWSVSAPFVGSGEQVTGTQTKILLALPTNAPTGAYGVANTITDDQGERYTRSLLIRVADSPVGQAYLSAADAEARLWGRFLIDVGITDGDVEAASDELDAMRPFIGWRQAYTQWRQFPRTIGPDGLAASADVPEAVLDAVALIAYGYATDEDPPVTTESIMGASATYARPKRGVMRRRVEERMRPYMRRRGQLGAQAPFVGADPLNQRQ